MLSLRKNSQHTSSSTCKWIPLPPLDRQWTDNEVYKYFKMTDDNMKLVKETKIVGYKDVIDEVSKTVFIKVKRQSNS
jgi:hypothetical protein